MKSLLYITFLIAALLGSSMTVMAQEGIRNEAYLFKGKLLDADSGAAVALAHIANPYKGTITVSNQAGAFTMPVEGGDTLLISRIGYVTAKFVVPLTPVTTVTDITLRADTEELKEVVITQLPSEARFKQQLLALQLPDDAGPELHVPHPSTMVKPNLDGNFTIAKAGGLISGFANKFNDKERGRQFKAEMAIKEQREAYLATKFNRTIVQQITGLEQEEELDAFLKFCVLNEDFLLKATEYEIHTAVLGCFKDFVASR